MSGGGSVKLATDEEREGGNLKLVKMFVGGEEVRRLTRAEAVGQFWEGITMAEEGVLYLRVIDGRKRIKDGLNLADAVMDDVPCKGNVPNRGSEQHEAILCSSRYAAAERVVVGSGGATPYQRLERVEAEPDFLAAQLEKVKGLLQVMPASKEGDVIEKGDVEE